MDSDENKKDGSPESLSKSIEDYDIATNNESAPDFNGMEDINSDSYDSIWMTNGGEENGRKEENDCKDDNDELDDLFVGFPNKIDDANISKLDSHDEEDKINDYNISYKISKDQSYSKLKCWAYFCIGWGIVFGCIIGGTVIIIYDQNMRKRLANSSPSPTLTHAPSMTISPSVSKIPSIEPSLSNFPSTIPSVPPSSLPSVSSLPTMTGFPSIFPTFYSNYPTFSLPDFHLSDEPSNGLVLSSQAPSLSPTLLPSLSLSFDQTMTPSYLESQTNSIPPHISSPPSTISSNLPTSRNSQSPSFSSSILPSNSDGLIVPSVMQPSTTTFETPSYSPTFIAHHSFKPSNEPSTEIDQIRATYLPILETISDPSDLIDPTTPQYQAADWIIFHDELNLQPNDPGLLQRYTLATFYFATTVDRNRNTIVWNKCGASSVAKNNRCDIDKQIIVYPFFSKFSECNWFGITCDERTGRIITIDISNNNLKGTLPTELFSLESLTKLNLSRNSIYGQVPAQVSSLTKLRTFHLSRNELTGLIPSEFGSLPDIHRIHVANNFLQGAIPKEIFSSNLKFLDLGGNNLVGTIPNQIYDSRLLQLVDLSSNELTGTISASFGTELKKLTTLLLDDNYLTGTIPKDLFSNKEKDGFKYLNFGLNILQGTIPQSLFNETNIMYFDVGANELTGTLSTSFGELIELEQLVLWSNRFTGTVPSEMSNMLRLEMLHLAQNNLMGSIPSAVCGLAQQDEDVFSVNSNRVIDISADCGGDVPLIMCDCCTICLDETISVARRGPL